MSSLNLPNARPITIQCVQFLKIFVNHRPRNLALTRKLIDKPEWKSFLLNEMGALETLKNIGISTAFEKGNLYLF